jgi:1-acyl-sn-glycerol-3-phosphate acyltransferase
MSQLGLVLRSLLFNLGFFAMTAAYSVWGLGLLLTGRKARLPTLGRGWAKAVIAMLRVFCGIRVKVSGLEHLPPSGPCLIASVHQSAFDTAIWMLLPRPAYVLKRELLKVPVFGQLMRPGGMIVVDRRGGARAIRELMRDGVRARDRQQQVVIFPEGTRGEPGEPRMLQPGVAALASAMGLPVIPVATNSGEHWGRRSFLKRPGTIHLVMGAAIPAGLPRPTLLAAIEASWRQLEQKITERPAAGSVDNPVGDVVETFGSQSRDVAQV